MSSRAPCRPVPWARSSHPRCALRALVALLAGLMGSHAANAQDEAQHIVRPAAHAGSWYPATQTIVIDELHRMLRAATTAPRPPGRLRALVVPHAGWRYSGAAAAAAFQQLEEGEFSRVVVVGPSHRGRFTGFSLPAADAYRTPLGELPLCRTALAHLRNGQSIRSVTGVHAEEHAIEVELPFLQETLGSFCLLPVLAGRTTAIDQQRLAARLAKLDDGKTLFVFSSDFTHYGPRYGYTPFGATAAVAREKIRALDERALALLTAKDTDGFRAFLDKSRATICGRHGLGVLLELLELIAPHAVATHLAGYTSIDLPGVDGENSVSYYALAFSSPPASAAKRLPSPAGGGSAGARSSRAGPEPMGAPAPPPVCPQAPPLPQKLGARLVKLARAALETELRGSVALHDAFATLPRARGRLDCKQAVFVTLERTTPDAIRREGRLRGCIGQVRPTYPLHQAVVIAADL